jgi:hypothetical protein
LEITKSQGKETIENMQKLYIAKDQKVAAAAAIAKKQLEYFKLWNKQLTNEGLYKLWRFIPL